MLDTYMTNQQQCGSLTWGEPMFPAFGESDSGAARPVIVCIGFGSRGGFRDTGVVRKEEPLEKPTSSTPVWPSKPAEKNRKPEERSQSALNGSLKIQ